MNKACIQAESGGHFRSVIAILYRIGHAQCTTASVCTKQTRCRMTSAMYDAVRYMTRDVSCTARIYTEEAGTCLPQTDSRTQGRNGRGVTTRSQQLTIVCLPIEQTRLVRRRKPTPRALASEFTDRPPNERRTPFAG